MLAEQLGGDCTSRNHSVTLKGEAGASMVRVAQTLAELGAAGRPSREDAWRHVEGTGRSRVSKFEPCLPEGLSRELLVDGLLDVEGARRAVRQRATPSNDSHL